MAFNLFGWTLYSPTEASKTPHAESFVPPTADGSLVVAENTGGIGSGLGVFGTTAIDMDNGGGFGNEVDMINKYRMLSNQPEVDKAISEIISEMIVQGDSDPDPVSINVDSLPEKYDDNFKEDVRNAFKHVSRLLRLQHQCYELARQFYVDGRLYFDMVIDEDEPQKGIVRLRNIDPRTIKPVKEIRERVHEKTGIRILETTNEYFLYSPLGFQTMTGAGGGSPRGVAGPSIPITRDRVAYIHSGILTPGNTAVLSHLHKAIKPANMLQMVEDATVIYRITRAPERRVFYIGMGDIPANKRAAYLQDVANRYRNRSVYDSVTGTVRDDRRIQSMLDDFFLPRTGGGAGESKDTEISTLPGGQNLGEIQDVEYFRRKLYQALNLPESRIESGGAFTIGRSAEITRDEVQFYRFLVRLRNRFSLLFDEILSKHLTLRNVVQSPEHWNEIRQYVKYEFMTDSHFAEMKEAELMNERLDLVGKMEGGVGKFFSRKYIFSKILRLSTTEQEEILEQIKEEASDDTMKGDDEGGSIGGGGGNFGGGGGGDFTPDGGGEGEEGADFEGGDLGDELPVADDAPPEDDLTTLPVPDDDDEEVVQSTPGASATGAA